MAVVVSSDPVRDARDAGLVYTSDRQPGIRRVRRGRHFSYERADGRALRDAVELRRIRALAIPPAWRDVWICASPRGHLQATGIDARGRKQYRYHARWRTVRDGNKYGRMIAFGESLPRLRARVARDLVRPGYPREKVLATIVRLLRLTAMRVGNAEYARENGTFGLTTLRTRHVGVSQNGLVLQYRGKSGKEHAVDVDDRRLVRILRGLQDLPGQDLFRYIDTAGVAQSVGSADVNAYLRDATGEEFSAKDFRTWWGSSLAVGTLREIGPAATPRALKRNLNQAMERVAIALGNTPRVVRASYVHPAVVESYADGTLFRLRTARSTREDDLDPDERRFLSLLRYRERMNGRARPAA